MERMFERSGDDVFAAVDNFFVLNEVFGCVKWFEFVDVCGLDFDKIVFFE